MNFKSFEELIQFAIGKEKEAIDFYENASTQERYSGGKETFLEFAKEEKKHKALLEGFLKGDKKLGDYQFKWVPDMKRSDYMVDLKYKKGITLAQVQTAGYITSTQRAAFEGALANLGLSAAQIAAMNMTQIKSSFSTAATTYQTSATQ